MSINMKNKKTLVGLIVIGVVISLGSYQLGFQQRDRRAQKEEKTLEAKIPCRDFFNPCSSPTPTVQVTPTPLLQNNIQKTETYWQCSGSVDTNGKNVHSQCYPETYTVPPKNSTPPAIPAGIQL
jgi:hypothetical protein